MLTILITNYNTSDFIELSLYSLKKLTKNSYVVYVYDDGSNPADYQQLQKIIIPYKNVTLIRGVAHQLDGEAAHSTALNSLTPLIQTPYFCILDSDAFWLKKNWDEILVGQLDHQIKAIGTQPPPLKPQDFPAIFAILLETETFKKLNVQFSTPSQPGVRGIGHQLRSRYLAAGFAGKTIESKITRSYKHGPFKDIICAEYYLDKDYQKIFASHFGRGSSGGIAKYQNLVYHLPIIGNRLLAQKGQKEKKLWLDLCRKIIDEQAD